MSHTPGPWTLETVKTSVGVCHKIGVWPSRNPTRPQTYGCVYEDGMHLWRVMDRLDTELLANARLMAAAPDLLEALRSVVDNFGPWHDPDCPCDDTCSCSAKPIHDLVNAAIRKAEGTA